QVSDDQAVFVYGRDGSRDIGRNVNQERPRSSGEFLQSALGAVQRMSLFGLADLFHHEADDLSVRRVTQRRYRPGREAEESFITEARENDEFLGFLRRRWLVINLCHQIASTPNFIDFAFRAGSDSARQSNYVRLRGVEDPANRANPL